MSSILNFVFFWFYVVTFFFSYDNNSKGCGEEVTECSDDFLLAKMLQLEFDKEHDSILKQEEAKINMGQKG